MKRVLLLMLAVLAPVAYAQGPTITNLAVTATGATTATIAWTTSVPATSQLLYGPTTPPQQLTPAVATLVTSHVLTVHGLTSGSNYYYQAISTDSGGKTTSGTQEFQLCAPGGSAQVGLSGTTNNYYEYGEYTIQWQNLSGQSVSPTVCGVPLTTPITGQLDYQSTFAVNIPSTLAIVPSPSGWQITETGIDNSIGAVTASFTTPGTATNITNQLAAAASGQLIHVWFDPATSTFYPALSSSSVVSFAAPAASWPTWLVPTVTNPTTTPSLTVSFDATSFPGCQAGYACTATYFNSTVPATGYELGGSSVGYAITMDASHYFHITNESVPQDVIATHGGGADDLILNGLPGLHGLPGFVDVGYGYNNSGGLQVYGGGTTLEASIATPGGIFKGGIGGYTLSASQNFGVFNYGTTPYSDTGIVGSYWGTVNNYIYDITGNSNSGTAARGCRMVGNDLTTAANNYGQLCINSSGYSGSGDTNQAGWVTLNSHGQDLAVGADGGYTLHLYASNADVATATGVNWYFTQLANTSLLATGAGGVLTAGNANNASAPANCIAASGSATAYTCATSPSAVIASYTQINFVPDVTSGTNPTLAVNGAAAAPIYQQQGTVEVTATDLLAGIPVTLTWNSGLGYWLTAGQNANTSAGKINGGICRPANGYWAAMH